MISSRSLAKHPPQLLELILLKMVYNSMIICWLQASAKVITTPPWFIVMCWGGLAAMLVLYHLPIIRIYNHFCWMMFFSPDQMLGSMYTPRKMQTLLYALSVLPLPTYLSMFPVPFVIVNSAVQRTSSKNSNIFFAKLFHCLTRLLSLVLTLTKKLLFLMEVIQVVLQSLHPRASYGDVIMFWSSIYKL